MHQLDRIEEMLKQLTGDTPTMHPSWVREHVMALFSFIVQDKKIEAIKEYRTLTGLPLKESKDAIEVLIWHFQRETV